MFEDNYLFKNEVLEILTKNLRIRILDEDDNFKALCYFKLPPFCDENEKFELDLANGLVLKASTLEYPLFTIYFEKEIYISNIDYLNEFYWYYEEAKDAIFDSLLWKECWISNK